MKDRIWEIDYEGHQIRVINKISLIPLKTSEILEIDGHAIQHHENTFSSPYGNFSCSHNFNGVTKKIKVLVAQKKYSFRIGAQVYINNEFIGGDPSLNYLDDEKVIEIHNKGFWCYFLKIAPVGGGSFAFLTTIEDLPMNLKCVLPILAFKTIIFGGGFSLILWLGISSKAKKLSKHPAIQTETE